jgi:hypothetical protein
MRKSMVASIAGIAIALASIPTSSDARSGRAWYPRGWYGPGVGLPAWGWRGQGWEVQYIYSPTYYGYGCYRPVLFWAPPPLGLAWQNARVC